MKPESSVAKPNKTCFPFQDLQPDQVNGKAPIDFSELRVLPWGLADILEEALTAPISPEIHRVLG